MTINLQRLNRAHYHVMGELAKLGLWSSRMAEVDVFLIPIYRVKDLTYSLTAYGWQNLGSDGAICIPALSGPRFMDWIQSRASVSLRDVLRHEWAHALAYHHPDLVNGPSFARAFDGDHDCGDAFEYDPEIHITEYASTEPMEDFAENFMLYVKHRGILPDKFQTPSIARRWRFIEGLRRRLVRR